MEENATERVIRRFGGQMRFAQRLETFTGAREYKQLAFRWGRRDFFPDNKLAAILRMCQADGLPIDHPQLVTEQGSTRRIA